MHSLTLHMMPQKMWSKISYCLSVNESVWIESWKGNVKEETYRGNKQFFVFKRGNEEWKALNFLPYKCVEMLSRQMFFF